MNQPGASEQRLIDQLADARAELREGGRRWMETADAISDALMVHDAEGRVVRANRAYAALAGMGFPELLGRPYWECFPRGAGPLAGCLERAGCAGARAEEFAVAGRGLFSSSAFALASGTAGGAQVLHIFRDITAERSAQHSLQAAAQRAIAQSEAISAIASSGALFAGDLDTLAREITEHVARACEVARVNVWLFSEDETELLCIDHFDAASRVHSRGMVLRQAQFRNEFRALKSAPYVASDDPLADPRTAGYVETYLKPNRISAMLDAVVEISGHHLGLLCLEHVDRPHHWLPDEIAFAQQVAEKIAIAVSNRRAREAEAALRESEQRFRTLFDQAPVGIAELDPNGRYLHVNRRLCQLTGYSASELRDRAFRDITHPEDLARDEANLVRLRDGVSPVYTAEKRYLRKDGTVLWAALSVTPLTQASGSVSRLVSIVQDIGERKAAERKLRESRDLLGSIIEHAPLRVFWKDAELRYLGCNSAFARDAGLSSPEELPGKDDFQMGWRAQAQLYRADDQVVIDSGRPKLGIEEPQTLPDGRTVWVRTSKVPLRDAAGRTVGVLGMYEDITESKRAAELLRQSEERFRGYFQLGLLGMAITLPDKGIAEVNDKFCEIVGHPREELERIDWASITHPDDLAQDVAQFNRLLAGEIDHYTLDKRFVRKDGTFVYTTLSVSCVRRADRSVDYIIALLQDISERKAAEARLLKLNRALRTLSAGNETLVRAPDEAALLDRMMRVLSEVGGYAIAWVGYAAQDDGRLVEPKACIGMDAAALAATRLTWADTALGQEVVGTAIRSGTCQIMREVGSDPRFAPWRHLVAPGKVRTVLGLPLQSQTGEAPFGAMGIGSADPDAFDDDELRLLRELAGDLAYGIASLRTAAAARAGSAKLRRSLESTIGAIAATMETRDPYTAGHQRRVADLAAAIAREMGLPADTVEGIHFGALLHDIGKIQVPAEILAKPTRLSKLEFEIIKTHPQSGYAIIKGIEFPWPVAEMVHQHHERLDGTGYPQGLKGEQIAFEARILAVADVVEAMSSHRPYRAGLGTEAALKEIEARRGTWFEPAAVDACLRLFRQKGYELGRSLG